MMSTGQAVAHAVDGAGDFVLMDVISLHFLEPGGVFVGRSQSGNFTLDDDALPGRQGKIFDGQLVSAKSAFCAFIDDRIGFRQRFEVLNVCKWIVVDDDSGIEQVLWIEYSFYVLHEFHRHLYPILIQRMGRAPFRVPPLRIRHIYPPPFHKHRPMKRR